MVILIYVEIIEVYESSRGHTKIDLKFVPESMSDGGQILKIIVSQHKSEKAFKFTRSRGLWKVLEHLIGKNSHINHSFKQILTSSIFQPLSWSAMYTIDPCIEVFRVFQIYLENVLNVDGYSKNLFYLIHGINIHFTFCESEGHMEQNTMEILHDVFGQILKILTEKCDSNSGKIYLAAQLSKLNISSFCHENLLLGYLQLAGSRIPYDIATEVLNSSGSLTVLLTLKQNLSGCVGIKKLLLDSAFDLIMSAHADKSV
jgi:hypothetical protein